MPRANALAAKSDARVGCLVLVLGAARRPDHPRLPPELLEPLCYAFCEPHTHLVRLCREGRLHALQEWHAAFGVHSPPRPEEPWLSAPRVCLHTSIEVEAVHVACIHGHVAVAQWVYCTFGLKPVHLDACLMLVCQAGQVAAARWLHGTLGLTLTPDRAYMALELACHNGHLAIAHWLHAVQWLDAPEAAPGLHRTRIVSAFQAACEGHHLPIARWLRHTFQLTLVDLTRHLACTFQNACVNGHVDTVRWLHRAFPWPTHRLRNSLWWAICAGQVRVVQYLMQAVPLTADDIGLVDGWTAAHQHPALHDWLMVTYGASTV